MNFRFTRLPHNTNHADSSPIRPRGLGHRPACRPLVRHFLPCRFCLVCAAGAAALEPPALRGLASAGLVVGARRGRPDELGRVWRGAGWAHWLLPVLQTCLLRRAPARGAVCVARRHEFSWRHVGRDSRHGAVGVEAWAALARSDRLCGALCAHGFGRRAGGQLHQWRVVGTCR